MVETPRAKRLLTLMAMALAATFALHPDGARSADKLVRDAASQSSSSDTRREKVKSQIDHFVSGIAVSDLNDSLGRWNTPVCPLVAGLPRAQGEFILARLSQIGKDFHVPFAGEHCSPNLYVVLTEEPDLHLKKWWKPDQARSDTCSGLGRPSDFMHTRGPVRVFYNAEFHSSSGAELSSGASVRDLAGATLSFTRSPCAVTGASVDTRPTVQSLTSAVIVVDSDRTTDINVGQLADYVAMVGFAPIRPDADTGMVPTILRLFRQYNQPSQGLSPWDESFLHYLYTADQNSVVQVSSIKAGMLEQVDR